MRPTMTSKADAERLADIRHRVLMIIDTRTDAGNTSWLYVTLTTKELRKPRNELISKKVASYLIAMLERKNVISPSAAREDLNALRALFATRQERREMHDTLTAVILPFVKANAFLISVHTKNNESCTFKVVVNPSPSH